MHKIQVVMDIDFDLLHSQKNGLQEIAIIQPEHIDLIEGMLSLIDAIQDQAVSAGIDENIVFPKSGTKESY